MVALFVLGLGPIYLYGFCIVPIARYNDNGGKFQKPPQEDNLAVSLVSGIVHAICVFVWATDTELPLYLCIIYSLVTVLALSGYLTGRARNNVSKVQRNKFSLEKVA